MVGNTLVPSLGLDQRDRCAAGICSSDAGWEWATSNSGSQKEAGLDAVNPRSAQTEPEAMTIRRRLPLGRTLLLELIALTLVAAVAFLFVQHGVPHFAEP